MKVVQRSNTLQRVDFHVVVSKDSRERSIQSRKQFERLCCGDVSRVYYMVDFFFVEDANDLGDVAGLIMSIAYDANSHSTRTLYMWWLL